MASKTDPVNAEEESELSNRGHQSKCPGCGEFFNTWEAEYDWLGKFWCGTDCLLAAGSVSKDCFDDPPPVGADFLSGQ